MPSRARHLPRQRRRLAVDAVNDLPPRGVSSRRDGCPARQSTSVVSFAGSSTTSAPTPPTMTCASQPCSPVTPPSEQPPALNVDVPVRRARGCRWQCSPRPAAARPRCARDGALGSSRAPAPRRCSAPMSRGRTRRRAPSARLLPPIATALHLFLTRFRNSLQRPLTNENRQSSGAGVTLRAGRPYAARTGSNPDQRPDDRAGLP